jgi:hypothetical protein
MFRLPILNAVPIQAGRAHQKNIPAVKLKNVEKLAKLCTWKELMQ